MGELRRHPIGKWRKKYGLTALVETGTWRGDGVLAALRADFSRVVTVDVDPRAHSRARKRVAREFPGRQHQVDYIVGDSAVVLEDVVRGLSPDPVLWWLDAHYPEQYSDRLGSKHPLLAEVEAITHLRDCSRDVFLADDLRIYGELGTSGPLPKRSDGAAGTRSVSLEPGRHSDLDDVVDLLRPTHDVQFIRRDGCYLLATPRH